MSLRDQIEGMIATCNTILARGKDLAPVDTTNAQNALELLKQAKTQVPGDKVLAAVTFPEAEANLQSWSWTAILGAMEMANRSLPQPAQQGVRRKPFSARSRR